MRVNWIYFLSDFPVVDEAYAIGRLRDGRYVLAWGWEYPGIDELPGQAVPDGDSGFEMYPSLDSAWEALEKMRDAAKL